LEFALNKGRRTANTDIYRRVVSLCSSLVRPGRILSISLHGLRAMGYEERGLGLDVLMVLGWKRRGIGRYIRHVDGEDVHILTVDSGLLKLDLRWSLLGDCLSERLFMPYIPLVGADLLRKWEVRLKKRIVLEALEELVWESPELAHELLIHPEYFIHEYINRRSLLRPPTFQQFLKMLAKDVRKRNIDAIMAGFTQAIKELADEGWVRPSDKYLRVGRRLLARGSGTPIPHMAKLAIKRTARLLMNLNPWVLQHQLYEWLVCTRRGRPADTPQPSRLEDSRSYLYLEVGFGQVSLSDDTTLEGFVRRFYPGAETHVQRIGWFLACTYLLTLERNGETHRVVVKNFGEEEGLKWIPVAFWALGAKRFAILGWARMRREYVATRLLRRHGVPAPEILYMSPRRLLLFKEYIEGRNLAEIVKEIALRGNPTQEERLLMRKAGRLIARIHQLGITLGDCKPENIMVDRSGELHIVDLEQAAPEGDCAWDLAEFVHFLAFYTPVSTTPPFLPPVGTLAELAKEFLKGYVEGGGSKSVVKKIFSPKYTRVLTLLVPHSTGLLAMLSRKLED